MGFNTADLRLCPTYKMASWSPKRRIGSFHFPQRKMFFPIHWQILKVLGISVIYVKFKMWPKFLSEFPILFSTVVTLKLGHNFSQFIHRFKIWILKCWSWAVYISKFFSFHKERKIWIFEKPRLHFQIFPNSLKGLKIEIFVPLPSYFVKSWGWSFSMTYGVREDDQIYK